MINVNATMFRAVALAVSTEATRYYLQGVYVEPHPVAGAILTATDGHILISAHDAEGICTTPAIVALDKVRLAACKAKLKIPHRVIVREDGTADIDLNGTSVETARNVIVDGAFPDWRRVLPRGPFGATVDAFNGELLGVMGTAAGILSDSKTNRTIRVLSKIDETECPNLVRFAGVDFAFGVVMPIRAGSDLDMPDWVNAQPQPQPAEAAE